MIDISDGLLADLGHIADSSGVLIDVSGAALSPGDPLIVAARAVAAPRRHVSSGRTGPGSTPTPNLTPDPAALDLAALGPAAKDPSAKGPAALDWVLTGGEDHSLAATFPDVPLPPRWKVIGAVRPGQGVVVDSQPWAHAPGWDHFA
jgi:thiamine-monophosphate kinase